MKWNDILVSRNVKGNTFESTVSKLVMKLVRRYDRDERETDGAFHWKTMVPNCESRFARRRMRLLWFRLASSCLQREQQDQVPTLQKTLKTSYCISALSKDTLEETWSRLSWWVMSLFYSSRVLINVTSSLQGGLIAGKESKEGRQTVFFTPLDPWRDEAEGEFNDDLSKPSEVHCRSKGKLHHGAVYWINLARAQEPGLQFGQTRSHAIIVHDSVPADCIGKVVCQKRDLTLHARLSAPRPALKRALKSAWK